MGERLTFVPKKYSEIEEALQRQEDRHQTAYPTINVYDNISKSFLCVT